MDAWLASGRVGDVTILVNVYVTKVVMHTERTKSIPPHVGRKAPNTPSSSKANLTYREKRTKRQSNRHRIQETNFQDSSMNPDT